MQPETKVCQNCKNEFTIESEDFLFYEKIKVPAPTFCFDCRTQRRMMFRNERTLYKRENNAPGKEGEQIISIHRPEAQVVVYDDRTWWSDLWDPHSFGSEYDYSKPFFQQFKELYRRVPLISLSVTNNVRCNFCNVSENDKGSYMLSGSERNEDCMYGNRVVENRQSIDMYIAFYNELCYEIVNCTKCFRTQFSYNSQECADSYFLLNCKNCSDCIGCINLRNAKYCILNQQYTKEEYEQKKKILDLTKRENIKSFKNIFNEFKFGQIFKYADNIKSDGSTGDNLTGMSRSRNTYDFQDSQDLNGCIWGMNVKNSYDAGPGIGDSDGPIYDSIDMLGNSNALFSAVTYHCLDIQYSINCHGCSHIFGCYGLRNKKYCILNLQYTKEEYEKIIPKIIEHMTKFPYTDSKGRVYKYGEFFPYDLSPFSYNETIAQEYYPLTPMEAKEKGFEWYERPERNYNFDYTIDQYSKFDGDISDLADKVFQCSGQGDTVIQCTVGFRLTSQEIELYKKISVPLPDKCYNCRHHSRLSLRRPMKLFHRSCMCVMENHNHDGKCSSEFETTYSPDRPEIIYCEACYQKEVL